MRVQTAGCYRKTSALYVGGLPRALQFEECGTVQSALIPIGNHRHRPVLDSGVSPGNEVRISRGAQIGVGPIVEIR